MGSLFNFIANAINYSLSFLPSWFVIAIVTVFALCVILLILKLIALVLDAIPFL